MLPKIIVIIHLRIGVYDSIAYYSLCYHIYSLMRQLMTTCQWVFVHNFYIHCFEILFETLFLAAIKRAKTKKAPGGKIAIKKP